MGQKEKLIQRLKSKPKDFTFEDVETLLKYLDYIRSNKGKTSGSRVMFVSDEHGSILLHKPHPQKELKAYQIKQLIEILEQVVSYEKRRKESYVRYHSSYCNYWKRL